MKSFREVFLFSIFLMGCSGLEQSERETLRRQNAKAELILRNHDEFHYVIQTPKQRIRESYPWEQARLGKHSKITKEFFRCRGSSTNPPAIDLKDPSAPTYHLDCGGAQTHSLPLREDKEFVYPILIDLLNFVQSKTDLKVVITCAHRCPVHNTYADSSPSNEHSKHLIGAEVDFYVQGMEQRPHDVVLLLMQYYRENPLYADDKQYVEFKRPEKEDLQVTTQPWFNKEIFIKLHKKAEGRDFDNHHPYPYITLQVRFDRERKERVVCSWPQAFKTYKRY